MATLLIVGEDLALLETRAAVLRTTGAESVCFRASSALNIAADWRFDLVVICHSVAAPIRNLLVEVIRTRWPQTRIMQLVPPHQGVDVDTDVDAISSSSPEDLVLNTRKQLRLADREQGNSQL